jgi:molybdopterin molybdotransferase
VASRAARGDPEPVAPRRHLMLSAREASERILAACGRLEAEAVPLDAAWGRILAAPIVAARALPPADNSAMDGFAVRASDTPGLLTIATTLGAGDPAARPLAPGMAARIMTGAMIPAGADAVVIREDADDRKDHVHLAAAARPGDHIRRRGEDVAEGDQVLEAGARLDPGAIALLAALGHVQVEVTRRPRVALISTGDELVEVGQEPGPGQIVSSSARALAAQIREAGGEPVDLGIVRDRPEDLEAAIARGLAEDVLVTTGGVSVGDRDHVKAVLGRAGVALDFWKVAIKPGKPLVFGTGPGGKPVFGLPGNPVSSMVVFELLVRPALLAMQGASRPHRPRAQVVLTSEYRKPRGRAHYARAKLIRRGAHLEAEVLAKQGSGMLSSMVGVDALVEIDADAGDVPAGTALPAILLGLV